jgi:hypothetical protein
MGLFKNRNELLIRIKRLVCPQGGTQTVKEKLIPGVVLLLTVLCLSWYSNKVHAQLVPDIEPPALSLQEIQRVQGIDQPDPPVKDTIPSIEKVEEVATGEEVETLPPMEPTEEYDSESGMSPDMDLDLDIQFESADHDIRVFRNFGDFEEDFLVMPPMVFEAPKDKSKVIGFKEFLDMISSKVRWKG